MFSRHAHFDSFEWCKQSSPSPSVGPRSCGARLHHHGHYGRHSRLPNFCPSLAIEELYQKTALSKFPDDTDSGVDDWGRGAPVVDVKRIAKYW